MRPIEIPEGGPYPLVGIGEWALVYVRPTTRNPEHDRFLVLHRPEITPEGEPPSLQVWALMPRLEGFGRDFKREDW